MFDGPIVYRKLRCFLGMPKKYLMVSRAPGVPKVSYFTVSGVLGVKTCRNLRCLGHLGCQPYRILRCLGRPGCAKKANIWIFAGALIPKKSIFAPGMCVLSSVF